MRSFALALSGVVWVGCNSTGPDSADTDGTGTTEAATTIGGTDPTALTSPTTDGTSVSTGATATSGTTVVTTTGTGDTGAETEVGSTSGGTGGIDCGNAVAGPIDPVLVTDALDLSEDLAFDGAGGFVAKQGDALVLVDEDGNVSDYAELPGFVYGLAFETGGDLLAAMAAEDRVVRVSPQGAVSDVVSGIDFPSGLHIDGQGRVWITVPGQSSILRLDADDAATTVVSGAGATSAGGVIFDAERSLLWFSNYDAGQLRNVPIGARGEAGTVEVIATIEGNLNGLALDACANVYGIDHLNSRLYRFTTDDDGTLIGEPELLAEFPSFVFNAHFGQGPGFSPTTLYATGQPGSVYAVEVGIEAAPP